jgi:hypothetical protein
LVEKSDLWIHGHVHDSADYGIGSTRVVSYPMGYPVQLPDGTWITENTRFDSAMLIEV